MQRDAAGSKGAMKPYHNLSSLIKANATRRSRALLLLVVVVEVQKTWLVMQQVALQVVIEYSARSGHLSLHIGNLIPIQRYVFLQHIIYIPPPPPALLGQQVAVCA